MPFVKVSWFDGKEQKAKQAVAKDITESIARNTGTDAQYIYVVFEDVAISDWAVGGEFMAPAGASK